VSLSHSNIQTIMIEFSEARINCAVVHKVGNKSREEGVLASHNLLELDDELHNTLMKYVEKGFKKQDTLFHFQHTSSLAMNEVYTHAKEVFNTPGSFMIQTVHLLNHLYSKSEHPHIKPGEFYVLHLVDVILEGELTEAIALLKSEDKHTFLKPETHSTGIQLTKDEGTLIQKLDKGALICNSLEENGYRVLHVDSNNYDAHYWKEDFLNIEFEQNDQLFTRQTFEVVKSFTNDVVSQDSDKTEQAALLHRTVKYFEEEPEYKPDTFAEKVLIKPAYKDEFEDYQRSFQDRLGIQPEASFEIAPDVVKQEKRKVKNIINLDTNIQIKLDFNDPSSGEKFIVKGYDEDRGMYYYTVYFNHERG